MKISGGAAKGILLKFSKTNNTRPATSSIRESLFSYLGKSIIEIDFLDLFSGSGSYGLESWSRGAKKGIFVENSFSNLKCLKENIKAVSKSAFKQESFCFVIKKDFFKFCNESINNNKKFEFIFVDPPYHLLRSKLEIILMNLSKIFLKSEKARLIVEAPGDMQQLINFDNLMLLKKIGKKRYGPNVLIFKNVMK